MKERENKKIDQSDSAKALHLPSPSSFTFVLWCELVPWRCSQVLELAARCCLNQRHNAWGTAHVAGGFATPVHHIYTRPAP